MGIVGVYGGLVYLSTVLGGWIADRLLGMERTLFWGGVVVMAGHVALAVLPGLSGVGAGLASVALGSGPGGFPGSDDGIVFFLGWSRHVDVG